MVGEGDAAKDEWFVRLDAPQDPAVVYEATSFEFQQLFPVGSGLFTFEDLGVPEDQVTRVVLEHGATRIELVVDYADQADVLDHADWLNARLVK